MQVPQPVVPHSSCSGDSEELQSIPKSPGPSTEYKQTHENTSDDRTSEPSSSGIASNDSHSSAPSSLHIISSNNDGLLVYTSMERTNSTSFFRLIQAFSAPKPCNSEREIPVLSWKFLGTALKKIIGLYSATPFPYQMQAKFDVPARVGQHASASLGIDTWHATADDGQDQRSYIGRQFSPDLGHKRPAHKMVEEKYRERVNKQFERILNMVPAEPKTVCGEEQDWEMVDLLE